MEGRGGFEICWDLTTALTNTDLVGNFLPAADHLINEGFSGDNKKCDANISYLKDLKGRFCTSFRLCGFEKDSSKDIFQCIYTTKEDTISSVQVVNIPPHGKRVLLCTLELH